MSGAIWTQIVPGELASRFDNATEALEWYKTPLNLVATYPPGTPQRDAVMDVYKHVQRLLCITGICLCIVLIFFACMIRNPRLGDGQSLENAEKERDGDGVVSDSSEEKKKFWLFK